MSQSASKGTLRDDGNKQHLSTSQVAVRDQMDPLCQFFSFTFTLLGMLKRAGILEAIPQEISTDFVLLLAKEVTNSRKQMESHPGATVLFADHSVSVAAIDMLSLLVEVAAQIMQLYPSMTTKIIEALCYFFEHASWVDKASELRNKLTLGHFTSLKAQLQALLQKTALYLVKVGKDRMALSNLEYTKQHSLPNSAEIIQLFDCLFLHHILIFFNPKNKFRIEEKNSEQLRQFLFTILNSKKQPDGVSSTTAMPSTDATTRSVISSEVSSENNKPLDKRADEEESFFHLYKQKLGKNANPETYSITFLSQMLYSSDSLPPVQELLSNVFMDVQDPFGNTALHSVIEAPEGVDVESVLKSVQSAAECLEVKNDDDLTPLNLAFQKKLWVQAHALAERQIQTRKDCVLLQEYLFRAMREQGGVDFLPHLLDLQKRYFPDLDLNFSTNAKGRTPWWYLVNSNDISVMVRVLQTLKDHSIDPMQLLTHTERQTKLVEEAAEKNRLLFTTIQKVVGSGADQDNADGDEMSSYFGESLSQITSCSSVPSYDEVENLVSEPDVPYKMPITGSQDHHLFSTKNRSTTIHKIAGDKNETSSDSTGTLSRTTSCSSISAISSLDQYKMGRYTCPDPPPPQDSPPPQSSSHSQDKRGAGAKCLSQNVTSWQPFKKLHSNNELEVTEHEVFRRERVLRVVPLDDLLPSKSPILISLATLCVNVLLQEAVRIKHWSWANVLHILNNETTSVIFIDKLFRESAQWSQGDKGIQVILTVVQNESLQDKLSSFLKAFAHKCVAKRDALQLHKVKNLKLTVSTCVMEHSGLKVQFDSFMRGSFERVLKMCTTPDDSSEPPHLKAYLTILLDHTDVSVRHSGYPYGVSQPLERCKDRQSTGTNKLQTNHVEQKAGTVCTDWQLVNNYVGSSKEHQPPEKPSSIQPGSSTQYFQNKEGDTPLQIACYRRSLDIVSFLFEKKCSANTSNKKGETAQNIPLNEDEDCQLHVAYQQGDVNIVKYLEKCNLSVQSSSSGNDAIVRLLSYKECNPSAQNKDGDTPLHIAVRENKTIYVSQLLATKKCNPNVQNANSETPLHIAVKQGQYGITVQLLSCKECDPNLQNKDGDTPLHIAVRQGHDDITDRLLSYKECNPNTQNKDGETPLHIAVRQGQDDITVRLLSYKECNPNTRNKDGETPLHIAVKQGQDDITVQLLSCKECNPNLQNKDGDTPLHIAVRQGHDEITDRLLSYKECNPNTRNKDGETPLHIAVKQGQDDITVQLLSCKECNPNLQNKDGDTPLHIACYKKLLKIVRQLLQRRCSTNIPSKKDETAQDIPLNEDGDYLLHIACQWGDVDIVRYLITDERCNPNVQSYTAKSTPLHTAAKYRQDGTIVQLVSFPECDPNVQNEDGDTPLHFVARRNKTAVISHLLAHQQCNPNVQNKEGDTPLHIACQGGHMDIVSYLVTDERCNPNVHNTHLNTPLHIACYQKSLSIIRLLLERKCATNLLNKKGVTAQDIPLNEDGDYLLHIACRWGDVDIVRYLITVERCNPNVQSYTAKSTPLHIACYRKSLSIINLLLERKCATNIYNKKGEIAQDLSLNEDNSGLSPPQSWDTEVTRNSNFASLITFIQFLPVEVLVLRDTAQGKTLCHALVGLKGQEFSSTEVTHLLELQGENVIQQCMICQDFSGNTPLHCAIEASNASTDVVRFLLRFATCESVTILNNDGLTPLELSYERKLWPITQLLIEYQIKTGASYAAELIQGYFFKSLKVEGGAVFFNQLLKLREHHCPNFDLSFSESRSLTPWWYLANYKEATAMDRVLQALKRHSIDITSLQTHTGRGTKLVEEAASKNAVLFKKIQKVAGWQCGEENQDAPGNEEISGSSDEPSQTSSPSVTLYMMDQSASDQDVDVMDVAKHKKTHLQLWLTHSDVESHTECEDNPSDSSSNSQGEVVRSRTSSPSGQTVPNKRKSTFKQHKILKHTSSSESDLEQVGCSKTLSSRTTQKNFVKSAKELSTEPLNKQPAQIGSELCEDSFCESSSEGGTTTLEADDSSDGGSERIKKAKCLNKRLYAKKVIPIVHKCCSVIPKPKKNSLTVVYQRSGYSGDDSDSKNECTRTKSSKFTSAQRAAAIRRKKQFYTDSSSEYSEAETEDSSTHDTVEDFILSGSCGIQLTFQFSSCALHIFNSTDCLSVISSTLDSRSTMLHRAVGRQCLQSVKNVLACDEGEDQIQMLDEEGHTPLEIASQNKDFEIFELLLETLICSQVSPSVTLPPCSGHQLMVLLTSIVKVLSKKEIDIDDSTLHWIMASCQLWKIPRAVYATPTTVLTMAVLRIDLCWSDSSQLVYSLYRGEVTKKKRDLEVAVQEQGIPSQSEMVSVARMGNFIVAYRSDWNSLVVGLVRTNRGSHEFHKVRTTSSIQTQQPAQTPDRTHNEFETRATFGIPPHQSAQLPDASTKSRIPNSTEHTLRASTDRRTLPHVVEDSPYSQPRSSAAKLSTHSQVSRYSTASLKPLGLESEKEVTAWQAWINKAVDCLHAGYYSQMLEVLKFGKVPPSFPPEIAMAAQFGCALAYYKLEKYSEAAKHLESLKTTAAAAQSCGNESIASVYLGDIEFTQSRYTEAAKHYSHALKLYKSDNLGKEYRLIVPTFSAISAKLGTAFRNTSKVVDAVQAYRQAIATADSKKDKLSAHTSLGNLFQSVGENASALAEYEHSIKLSEELRDYVSLGWAHGNMGNAYLGLYQRDKGLYHLEKALDLTVEHEPTPQAIGRAYNNLGTAYQALNELDKAEEKYDLALSQSIYGNDLPGQARVYGNIGNVLMLRKDYDRAVPHYTEVLRLSRDRSTVSTAFHNRGCSYYEWAESKKATLPHKAGFSLHGPEFENCEVEHQPSFKSLPNSILKYYQLGRQDLEQVIKYHEETFENIKGSSKGLTLSVSLFETNSRTFHRLQDCLVNLGEWEKALVVAEQSRTRTLGELLVKRKNSKIDYPLTAPLNLQSITDIVQSQHSVVVYLSYTGARLLGWVLSPTPDKVSVDMFEVPLEDDQFDGKSFDYHLRYSLTEELVERSFEMYRAVDYKSDLSEPVRKLYKLVCKPLMKILKELKDPESTSGVQEMIIIPDSYTCLLPFPCLLDEEDKFLGDSYSFRIMPSLLTMGIVDQLPSVVVQVPADGRSMCVVGNPTIPSFMYNGDQWSLGKLPFATREAEWVANILKTTPILHEQATKDSVLMRIMNAKVIHIATHGSASAGFLAFAGMSSARNGETVEAKNVLLYPEDIERLSISPALVVLSSCDSARGTVKADGILGMARAFILAGAQAVLTTLWRVPDESASVFMQFFYQYLMDGLKASLALQKSTLSVRCFSKYSQYIHWSGYQLTGREIQFDITKPSTAAALEARLGKSSVFPRLEVVQQLESAFLKDPCASSDVQILKGPPGVKPSEPLVDFIHSFHDVFKGGIFWINGRRQEFVDTSAAYIRQSTGTGSTALQTHPVLVVFDYIDQLPQLSTSLFKLLKQPNTHIVVISKNYARPDTLLREIDNQLLRGCNIIDVKPLSPIHTTQRIVHSILSAHHLAPANEDQEIFEKLAQFTSGSPALIDVTAALFLSQMEQDSQNEPQNTHDTLINLNDQLSLDEMGPSTKPVTIVRRDPPKGIAKRREISKNVYDNIVSIRDPEQDPWCTSSPYDSWQAITMLIDQCHLSAEEKLLLFAVSMFSCSPIPMSVVTEVSSMIAKATHKPHISTSLHSKLFQMQLMKRYPLPVILHLSLGVQQSSSEPEIVYIPQYIARAIWKDMMSDEDKVVALTTMYMALHTLADNLGSSDVGFLTGLTSLLVELYELNYKLMGKQCYQEVYKLYLQMKPKDGRHPTPPPDTRATPPHPTPAPDTGATPPHPTPDPDTGATPPHPAPAPDTGATPPHPTPDPDTCAIPPHPTPDPDTGATPPHPTPDPDTGATLSHPTSASDAGAPSHRPTPAPQTARDLTEHQSPMTVAEMKRPKNITHT